VLDEGDAVALLEAVHRIRVVELVRKFAEQIDLVGLADIFAGEVNDALDRIRLGAAEEFEVRINIALGEAVKGSSLELFDRPRRRELSDDRQVEIGRDAGIASAVTSRPRRRCRRHAGEADQSHCREFATIHFKSPPTTPNMSDSPVR
jgi:hypothetical protein